MPGPSLCRLAFPPPKSSPLFFAIVFFPWMC
jgi:hypothetical protein